MYEVNINNKFYRVFVVTTDKYGIDPLRDLVTARIANIRAYKNHEVTQDERGAPDLISLREYETEDYWWHILTYNGICRFRDIVQGMTLKIPDIGSIINITNNAISEAPKVNGSKVITI